MTYIPHPDGGELMTRNCVGISHDYFPCLLYPCNMKRCRLPTKYPCCISTFFRHKLIRITSSLFLTQQLNTTTSAPHLGLLLLLCPAVMLDLVQNTKHQLFFLWAQKNNSILCHVFSLWLKSSECLIWKHPPHNSHYLCALFCFLRTRVMDFNLLLKQGNFL